MRNADELCRSVSLCARAAARKKLDFRLGQLSGFMDRWRNESKLRRWGLELEQSYEHTVQSTPALWDPNSAPQCRTIQYLWQSFGLGEAHTSEAVYANDVALEVLSMWLAALYPATRISSSSLADELTRLGIKNTQNYESLRAQGIRASMKLPIEQLIDSLDQHVGAYS